MEEQVLGKLIEDGMIALEYQRTAQEAEAEALLEMVEQAKMRGFELAQKALELTTEEFNAFAPEWFGGDDERHFGVILHAYKRSLWVELRCFEFLEEQQTRAVKLQLLEGGNHWANVPATRTELALWLIKAQEEELRDAIVESVQERNFVPFIYYKVWYGDNWDYDFYNLRNLPTFEYQQFGMTVDEPWRLVWVPKPVRVEQVCVNAASDLPDWCPSLTFEVHGKKMSVKVSPSWAGVREADGWLTPVQE